MVFHESQRFRQWFFWLPIGVVTFIVWYLFFQQVLLSHPQGNVPVPNWLAILLAVCFGLGFPAFAAVVRLTTDVTAGEVNVRLVPFRGRTILLSSVASAEERTYSPMSEFGGYGIRVSRAGRAYNAYGNLGVQLVLDDGSRILIGTQRPQELIGALRAGGVGDGRR